MTADHSNVPSDERKSRKQLIQELARLRARLAAAEGLSGQKPPGDAAEAFSQAKERPECAAFVLEAAVEAIAEGLVIHDAGGRIIRMNRAAERLLGYSQEESRLPIDERAARIGLTRADGSTPPIEETPLFQALQGNTIELFELRYRRADMDRWGWAVGSAVPIKSADGTVLGVVTSFKDVSVRVETRQALQESERRYRTLFSSLQEGFALCETMLAEDGRLQDLRYLEVNEAAGRNIGGPPEALKGRTVREAFPGVDPSWIADFGRVVESGEPLRTEGYWPVTGKWIETYAYRPEKEKLALLFLDISERKEAEQRIAASNARTEAILRSLHEGVVIFDLEGNVLDMNPAALRIHGFAQVEEARRPMRVYSDNFELRSSDGELLPVDAWPLARVVQGETFSNLEVEVRNRKTREAWTASYSGAPVRAPSGEIPLGVVTIRDVTAQKRMESALRASEEKYRTLFDNMTEGFALCQAVADASGAPGDYRYLEVNRAYEQITGISAEKVVGRTAKEISPIVAPEQLEVFLQVAHTGVPASVSFYSKTARKWLEVYAYSPRKGFTAGVFRDISRRTRAEKALRASEERARRQLNEIEAIYDFAPIGLCVLDRQLRYVRINRRLAEINGLPVAEHIGRTLGEVVPALASTAAAFAERILRTGEAVLDAELCGFVRGLPGQQRFRLEQWLPLREASGEIVGINVVVEDITERKRSEEALQRLNETLEQRVAERTEEVRATHQALVKQSRNLDAFFQHSLTPLVLLDKDFNFIRVNEAYARAGQKKVEDFLGRNHFELYPSEAKTIFEEVVRSRRPYQVAARPFSYPDHPEWGTTYWDWTLTPLLNRSGEVEVLVFALQDVTLRRKAEIELERYRDYLEEMVRERTRELEAANRHLEAEIGKRSRAEESLRKLNEELEQRVKERTAEAESRASQLQALTLQLTEAEENERRRIADLLHDDLQQLLASSRFQLSLLQPSVQGQAAAQLVLRQVDLLLGETIQKSRRLSHELSPAILHHSGLAAGVEWLARHMKEKHGLNVEVDARGWIRLEDENLCIFLFRCVQEILFNVVKHARVDEASVRLEHLGDRVEVRVSDSGAGFDPGSLEETARQGEGYGLFSIGERVRYMGGSLTIESSPGKGSRMALSVPLRQRVKGSQKEAYRPALRPQIPASRHREGKKSARFRVLLADDHEVIRQGLVSVLESQPDIQVVGEAADGREALEMARSLDPDVVVMDVVMPGMDGIEATRLIKRELPRVRVIGLSMLGDEEVATRLAESGAEACLSKAGTSEALFAAIRGKGGDRE